MNPIHIRDFLKKHDIDLGSISLGDIDQIGEFTAKKRRDPGSELYNKVGAFFRPNYERGVMIYGLIKRYKFKSFLEVGFGRGFSAVCAAKAFHDIGVEGKVTSIDVKFDQDQLETMKEVFPKEWLSMIDLKQGSSQELLQTMDGPWDLVYIDGDHRAAAVQQDWNLVKNKWNSIVIFDDYHLPTKKERDIECAQVIDKIDEKEFASSKDLVRLDRRLFLDDRGYADEAVDYGQIVMVKDSLTKDAW